MLEKSPFWFLQGKSQERMSFPVLQTFSGHLLKSPHQASEPKGHVFLTLTAS